MPMMSIKNDGDIVTWTTIGVYDEAKSAIFNEEGDFILYVYDLNVRPEIKDVKVTRPEREEGWYVVRCVEESHPITLYWSTFGGWTAFPEAGPLYKKSEIAQVLSERIELK